MKFYQVSAFSTDPFKGNPAGICVLEKLIDKEEMQKIARVTNLPATAFIFQALDSFQLRWFTPNSELPLCGHATLASAYIIWEKGLLPKTEKIVFHTGNGDLSVRRHDAWMEMEFPSYSNIKTTLPAELLKLFDKNIREVAISNNRFIIEFETEEDVKGFKPDYSILKNYSCILTSRGSTSSPYDFISRFFTSVLNGYEDAVTGSSHCSLAPYWSERLFRNDFFAYQASERGGELKIKLANERVFISGRANIYIEGEMNI